MTPLQNQIVVSRSIEEAFDYTADLNHLKNRHPDVVASAQTSPGPIGVGTTYDVLFRFANRQVPMVATIVEYEPPIT